MFILMPKWRSRVFHVAFLFGSFAASLVYASAAYAQLNGCVDSPENPTVILALIGAAAAGLSMARSYSKSRKQKPRNLQ
jgi:XrtJ-associated TM-motif-TM protein